MDDERIGPIHDILFQKADQLVHEIYDLTYQLPKDELFGVTSQVRRAAISIPLNITEGYARMSAQDHRRFLEIAYGSLKETKYLLYFCNQRSFISKKEYEQTIELAEEIARLLWRKITTIRSKIT